MSPCSFDVEEMQFIGSSVEQAQCLLRGVKKYGEVDNLPKQLPETLKKLVGNKCDLSAERLTSYLQSTGIPTEEVGGAISDPLSKTSSGKEANYFVIHDMSTPEFDNHNFPDTIDTDAWKFNDLEFVKTKRAHVYVGRTGKTKTMVDFKIPWRATKFELRKIGERSKGLFIHIELLQPRRKSNEDTYNATAPTPGFTTFQYEKLALLYLCASVRKKSWLIPCYHAVLDIGLTDGHDDPQNFEFTQLDFALRELLNYLDLVLIA